MRSLLHQLSRWLARKTAPPALLGSQWSGTSYVDAYKRSREPRPNELLAELKGMAWTCISLNAAVCATLPPRLYVVTRHHQPRPKCLTKRLEPRVEHRLRAAGHLAVHTKSAAAIEEVTAHPLLDLLSMPNPWHNQYDLWELTQVYLEVHGQAFWHVEMGPLGTPAEVWILPSQNVTPKRAPNSPRLIDYYSYRTGAREQEFPPQEIVHFRYPDPRDPYLGGISPLRAAYEQINFLSGYTAFKNSTYENNALPAALITPDDVIGEEERDRLETQIQKRFRRGGAGRVLVGENKMHLSILSHSMGDLAALADAKATKEDVANAFHCPISFFTTQTNLANLQASTSQHMQQAIGPRLERRDEKLNQCLVPLFDPTGRLFLASEDPVPVDQTTTLQQQEQDLKYGVLSVNEVRGGRGLPPVAWGNVPWLPDRWLPTDQERTSETNDPRSDDTGTARTGMGQT
jgi:HK97 family phage portal protein